MTPHVNAAKSSGQRNVTTGVYLIDLLSKQRNHIKVVAQNECDWPRKAPCVFNLLLPNAYTLNHQLRDLISEKLCVVRNVKR